MRTTRLIAIFALAACGPSASEVSLAGTDLVATFGAGDHIPGAASPGPQTLHLTVAVEVPTLACEGFASCLLKSSHVEHIPIVIAP